MTKKQSARVLWEKTTGRSLEQCMSDIDALAAAGIQFDPEPVEKMAGEKIADRYFVPWGDKTGQLAAEINAAIQDDRQARKPSQPAVELAERLVVANHGSLQLVFNDGTPSSTFEDCGGYVGSVRSWLIEAFELANGGEAKVDWKKEADAFEELIEIQLPGGMLYRPTAFKDLARDFFRSKVTTAKQP